MKVKVANLDDFASWLGLAREVEPLFGPMVDEPSFQHALQSAFATEQAFCVREDDGISGSLLCGGIVIDLDKNEVSWFAVARKHRRKGIGEALLKYALNQLDMKKDISVTTFAQGVAEGIPARELYLRFEFEEVAPSDPTPAGIQTAIMIRPGKSE